MTDRRRFDQRAFDTLRAAADEVCDAVPEVEAVAVVILWRLPDQGALPSTLLVSPGGPVANPDQLARLSLAVNKFQLGLVNGLGDAVLRLAGLAEDGSEAPSREQAQPPQGQGET